MNKCWYETAVATANPIDFYCILFAWDFVSYFHRPGKNVTVEHNRVFLRITTDTRCNRGPSGTVVHGNVGAVGEIDDTLTTINLTTPASLKLTTEILRRV